MSPQSHRNALIVGASGLVGQSLREQLLQSEVYDMVIGWGRRSTNFSHPKWQETVVDFAPLFVPDSIITGQVIDDVYICLGTTIKVAGSQAAMRLVDFDAVINSAKAALGLGAKRVCVVSAMGANAKSRIFYNRLKGEMEQALAALGFAQTLIVRPSFIAPDAPNARADLGQQDRAGEGLALRVMRWINPLIPANYKSVKASDIAGAMLAATVGAELNPHAKPHVRVLLSGELHA